MSKTQSLNKPSKNYCGECCWFVFENTDGHGQCMKVGGNGLPYGKFCDCSNKSCKRFVSREDKKRYIDLLHSFQNWMENNGRMADGDEFVYAVKFATEYIETFGQL